MGDGQAADLHLAVAFDGYGWHRQAWRSTLLRDPATPSALSGRYWSELARTAERGLLDFVSIDDALTPQPGRRAALSPGRLAGRGDAVLVAARMATATSHIGLIPVATTTHTEPFHVSTAIATLDYVSRGRAGWQPRISSSAHEAALFGRRNPAEPGDPLVAGPLARGTTPLAEPGDPLVAGPLARGTTPLAEPGEDLFSEATDFVEVVRRLWDSWEDDAVIRDTATGRYIDRDKLHYIDFEGPHFSVKGPSITPRPPQGQPVVAALAHARQVYEFAAATSDLVFITPHDDDELRALITEIGILAAGRLQIWADLVVTFGGDTDFGSDALITDAPVDDVAGTITRWHELGVAGVRLRPAVHAVDLPVIVDELVPLLQQSGRYRTSYRDDETLRQRLGLPLAHNRYEVNVS